MKDKLRTSLLKFEEAWKEINAIWGEHPEECDVILTLFYPFHESFDKLGISDWIQSADERMGNKFKFVPISPDGEIWPVDFTSHAAAQRYIETRIGRQFWKHGGIKTKDGRLLGLQEAVDACRIISYNTNSDENETD